MAAQAGGRRRCLPAVWLLCWRNVDGRHRGSSRGRTAYLRETEPLLREPPLPAGRDKQAASGICRQNWNWQTRIETQTKHLRFVVIGAGRLGASLGLALRARGEMLLGYTAGSEAGRARAEGWLGGRASATLTHLVTAAPDLYIIAVPDRALPGVAQELGAALAEAGPRTPGLDSTGAPPPTDVFVAHTSGATSSDVLRPCEEAGAATFVFHPLQTFSDPLTGADRFAGAAIAVTPADPDQESPALSLGFSLAHLLGAHPFALPDDKRSLYHAAASFACNYFVTLEHHAKSMFVKAGLPEDEALALFLPLVRATLDNMAAQGTVEALTGPLSRGDVHTIASHLDALAADAPHLLGAYRALGLATLDLVRARDEVSPMVIVELERLLQAMEPRPPSPPREDTPGA